MNIKRHIEQFKENSRLVMIDFGELIMGLRCYGRVIYSGIISMICGCIDNGTGGALLNGCMY